MLPKFILISICFVLIKINATRFRDKYFLPQTMPPNYVKYLKEPLKPDTDNVQNLKIGILGAGMSGLYSALLLDSLDIDFEILEANEDHIGGRVFTYYFSKSEYNEHNTCREYNDYADMGPVRIPSFVTRFVGNKSWSLVKYLNENNNNNEHRQQIKLTKFIFSNPNTFYFFNGRKLRFSETQENDALGFGERNNDGTGVPDAYANENFTTWIDYVQQPFLELMKRNRTDEAFSFFRLYDDYSVRNFMQNFDAAKLCQHILGSLDNYKASTDPSTNKRIDREYPQIVVDWLETLDVGTGQYDQSLVEYIIDAFDFTSVDWLTIDGGMSKLVDALVDFLSLKSSLSRDNHRLRLNNRVTRITKVGNNRIGVTTRPMTDNTIRNLTESTFKSQNVFTYDHVISTLPLGVLQSIETSSLELSLKKRMAIRELRMGSSVKIAIRFRTRFWQYGDKPIIGGQTFTDLPIRKIIYPSHGLDCLNATGTLIVSYTWAQDATRIGSRAKPKVPSQAVDMSENELIEDILDQLTLIHGKVVRQEYDHRYFVMNWNANPLSMGSFASFGPSQFNTLYSSLIRSEVNGRVHFGGEAASVHHGWIEGALNSGYKSVMEILIKENLQSKLKELIEKWGRVDELDYFS